MSQGRSGPFNGRPATPADRFDRRQGAQRIDDARVEPVRFRSVGRLHRWRVDLDRDEPIGYEPEVDTRQAGDAAIQQRRARSE